MSTSLPNSPMLLDSTGQAMVDKLERIRNAILNGGGGGGGTTFTAPPYDASIARHGSNVAYRYGDYCTYEDTIYRCIVYGIYVSTPPAEFDSTKWEAVESLAIELSSKPGRIVDTDKQAESFNSVSNNQSTGYQSHAEGYITKATNNQAHAEGNNTTASGSCSHAEGNGCTASGSNSHAEGSSTEATNNQAHSEGSYTHATGNTSHAEGSNSRASGNTSHAEGGSTLAEGSYSHSEGSNTKAYSNASHAEGSGSTVQTNSDSAHAEGYNTEAKGQGSHVEGYNSKALNQSAHGEGYRCEAKGMASHAQGYYSVANGPYSSANGYYIETKAESEYSVGMYNSSVDDGSTLSTYWSTSISYAVGDKVKLYDDNTHTIYQCNTAIAAPAGEFDPSKWDAIGTYDPNQILFSVGNGDWSNRKNAIEVRKDGTIYLNGIELPKPPSADGTYTLQCTVASGVVTYSWV